MPWESMKKNLLEEMKKQFRPEFLNRIDDILVFQALSKEHIRKIVDLMMINVGKQLEEKEIKLEVTDAAKDFLGEKGYDEVFGARPLRRVIQDRVEDKMSDMLLRSEYKTFNRVYEISVSVPDITDEQIGEIKKMSGIFDIRKGDDALTVIADDDNSSKIAEILSINLIKESNKIKIRSTVACAVVDVKDGEIIINFKNDIVCLLYTSPSPRDRTRSRMPSSA